VIKISWMVTSLSDVVKIKICLVVGNSILCCRFAFPVELLRNPRSSRLALKWRSYSSHLTSIAATLPFAIPLSYTQTKHFLAQISDSSLLFPFPSTLTVSHNGQFRATHLLESALFLFTQPRLHLLLYQHL
jgi:hypothetical protein